jgi:hypothetical protein
VGIGDAYQFAAALLVSWLLTLAQLGPAAVQGGKYLEAPALAEKVTAGTLSFAINRDEIGKFPFTGGVKFDPRNSPIQTLTLGPLYYRWLTSNGKESVEPIEPLKRVMQLIDTARVAGYDGQVKAAQELFRIWADNMFEIGTVGLTPVLQEVTPGPFARCHFAAELEVGVGRGGYCRSARR